MQDRRITVRELADEVGVSIGSEHTILTADLAFRRVSAKFVPKLPTMEQKQLCLEIAQGTRFESRKDTVRNTTAQLYMIPQEAFQKCFQKWQDRWKKCVHYQGDYFEGD